MRAWRRRGLVWTGLLLFGGACADPPTSAESGPVPWRSGARLRAVRQEAAGGAARRLAWFDTELQIRCSFQRAADEQLRCLPLNPWRPLSTLGRPDCPGSFAAPIEAADCPECGPSDLVLVPLSSAPSPSPCSDPFTGPLRCQAGRCGFEGPRYAVHALGAPTDCRLGPPPSVPVRAIDEALPPDRFLAGRLVVEPVDLQLDRVLVEGEDGSREPLQLRDHPRDRACGELGGPYQDRCLSVPWLGQQADGYFADSACQTPLSLAWLEINTSSCAEAALVPVFRGGGACGGQRLSLHPLGPAITPGPRYRNDLLVCEAVASEPTAALHSYGEAVPAETFFELPRRAWGTGALRVRAPLNGQGQPLLEGQWADADGYGCTVRKVNGVTSCVRNVALFADLYADAACREPIIAVWQSLSCGRALPNRVVRLLDPWTQSYELRELGPQARPSKLFRQGPGAECHPTLPAEPSPDAALEYWRVGELIPSYLLPNLVEVLE